MSYRGQDVAFLTQHSKEGLLRPLFLQKLGCTLHPNIHKGLDDWPSLVTAFHTLMAQSTHDRVFAEVDQRAYLNPSRQQMIVQAAEDLINKISSTCPSCDTPGYWLKERVTGLPCGLCGAPTRLPVASILRCDLCGHTDEQRESPEKTADPSRCDICNP